MMTVNEVSKLTGVSIRTLHYYDKIGLLHPSGVTGSGYRLYDDMALQRLQHILLFRELQFPLKDIRTILDSPDFDRNRMLEQQITLLQMRKEHLENLIAFARGIQGIGVRYMDFSAFNAKKIDDYAKQAKGLWSRTPEYRELEEKSKNRSPEEEQALGEELMDMIAEIGSMQDLSPADEEVQEQVKKIQEHITENCYTCTNKILRCLGRMFAGGGSITEIIDKAGGQGTAEFIKEAIDIYCEL